MRFLCPTLVTNLYCDDINSNISDVRMEGGRFGLSDAVICVSNGERSARWEKLGTILIGLACIDKSSSMSNEKVNGGGRGGIDRFAVVDRDLELDGRRERESSMFVDTEDDCSDSPLE